MPPDVSIFDDVNTRVSVRQMAGMGQFGQFTPSRLSDRNGFVEETLAGTGATDGNAPYADRPPKVHRPQNMASSSLSVDERRFALLSCFTT
jgi:hypothetical protein